MRLHFPPPGPRASAEIVSPANSPSEGLELALLRLPAGGAEAAASEGRETLLVVLGGCCDVETGGLRAAGLGDRPDVWSGRAASVYIPAGAEYRIASAEGAEVAVLRAPASPGRSPYVIGPQEVEVATRGRESWRREVHTILDEGRPAESLIVGETFNEPGAWSSYPPHKHDVDDLPRQALLQEVYHFRLNPPQGFGIQRLYSPERDLDSAYVVRDGDTVLLPFGYHPVVAGGGYRLYYLWALAGRGRQLSMVEDSDHSWLARA